jgi:putative zinc finger/helix-turn-helix YgiT family protein
MAETSGVMCPICGEGMLSEIRTTRDLVYKGRTGRVPFFYSVCDACGSEQGTAEQTRSNKRAFLAFQKEVDGLLTGEDVAQLLDGWGITQMQAARIFGGGAVAFSKYKHDDVKQSEAMDNLLRVAAAVPEAFAWLVRYCGAPAEREVASLSETLLFRGLVGGRRSGLRHSYAVMLEQEDQTMVFGRASANADRFREGELQETA